MNALEDLLVQHTGFKVGPRAAGHADLSLTTVYSEDVRAGILALGRSREGTTQTIAAGVIDFVESYMLVDTESAAASDDLDTVLADGPIEAGTILVLQAANDARTIVVKHGTGNLFLAGGADFSLDNLSDTIELVYSPAKDGWCEKSRSANG
jgi:hypothetical protein